MADLVGVRLQTGPRYWADSYRTMARWQLVSLRMFLPVVVAVQALLGVGLVLGLGLFLPPAVPPRTVLYIATGVPVFNLYMLGLIVMPQTVGQQRITKTYDFLRSLPVPAPIGLLTWLTVTLLAGVPGMLASLLASHWRYGFRVHPSPAALLAVLLVATTATAIGAALAHTISEPMTTMVLTQVLNFVAVGFSPVAFPPEALPGWLVTLNQVLPFEAMATAMRAGLTDVPVTGVAHAYLLLSCWSAGCVGLALWALGRRG